MQNKSEIISIELCPIEFLFPLLIDVRGSGNLSLIYNIAPGWYNENTF